MFSKIILTFILVGIPFVAADAQRFRTDDPILEDRDDRNIERPARRKINDQYDFLENTFFPRGDRQPRRSLNINSLGEVPDSSWYTNRIGKRPMSEAELVTGSNSGTGPVFPLTVTGGKAQGISPGMTVQDATGTTYFLKFDPKSNPEMATAAEVITGKFLHALGYNVPELYIIRLDPAALLISSKATIRNELDKSVPLTREAIQKLIRVVAVESDGTVRAIASKLIPGENVGPFKFRGTRSDDPNDIFAHEDRRELRAYRVVSAWLNHDDSRSINTLDMYVRENDRSFVRHYLIDFGSTLGSGSVFAQKRRPGHEYMWEAKPTFASIASLGIWIRPWANVRYPNFPSIGRFEGDFFAPEKWKPEYPNPAFDKMQAEDAFWAARLVMRFSDGDIRAIVRTGLLSDPAAAEYLTQTLIKRRDKIGRYWLAATSSLDGFRLEGNRLLFEDLLEKYGFADAQEYSATLESFDNANGRRSDSVKLRAEGGRTTLSLDLSAAETNSGAAFFVVSISTGSRSVDVFLRRSDSLSVVGIQRY